MATTIYIKKPLKVKNPKEPRFRFKTNKNYEKIFFITITLVGFSAMLFAALPLIIWEVETLPRLTAKVEVFPVPKNQVLSEKVTAGVQVIKDPDGFSYFTTDFKPKGQRPKEYYLSIPKLKIDKAQVKVDSLTFDQNLAHFPGTAIPGEAGNAFVTGHSSLPEFADVNNYRSVFTNLSDLQIGDTIIVENNQQKLEFIVQYSKIVDPRDLSVLFPISPTARNLTLMTCVPPGTNSKRLVVITSLI